mmetsp:Transcript_19197/g.43070  ORF Transcript_19197/g.43070 Transcript_19197/m.43070 type:complete len:223 (-) Transcript_19197:145-813(-)
MALCVLCGVREQSKHKGVKFGQCCNKCPNHGPWCSAAGVKVMVCKKIAPKKASKALAKGSKKIVSKLSKLVKVTVVGGKVALCVNCHIWPQSKRKGVRKGWCCNKCPTHGPWCSSTLKGSTSTLSVDGSLKRSPSALSGTVKMKPAAAEPAPAADPAPAAEGALCVNCHEFPQSTQKGVRKGWCCNKCPSHGPWCSSKAGVKKKGKQKAASAEAKVPETAAA